MVGYLTNFATLAKCFTLFVFDLIIPTRILSSWRFDSFCVGDVVLL